MSLHKRLERLEGRLSGQSTGTSGSPNRARMRAFLDEFAAAKREGRAPSAEAEAVSEAILRRRRQHEP